MRIRLIELYRSRNLYTWFAKKQQTHTVWSAGSLFKVHVFILLWKLPLGKNCIYRESLNGLSAERWHYSLFTHKVVVDFQFAWTAGSVVALNIKSKWLNMRKQGEVVNVNMWIVVHIKVARKHPIAPPAKNSPALKLEKRLFPFPPSKIRKRTNTPIFCWIVHRWRVFFIIYIE